MFSFLRSSPLSADTLSSEWRDLLLRFPNGNGLEEAVIAFLTKLKAAPLSAKQKLLVLSQAPQIRDEYYAVLGGVNRPSMAACIALLETLGEFVRALSDDPSELAEGLECLFAFLNADRHSGLTETFSLSGSCSNWDALCGIYSGSTALEYLEEIHAFLLLLLRHANDDSQRVVMDVTSNVFHRYLGKIRHCDDVGDAGYAKVAALLNMLKMFVSVTGSPQVASAVIHMLREHNALRSRYLALDVGYWPPISPSILINIFNAASMLDNGEYAHERLNACLSDLLQLLRVCNVTAFPGDNKKYKLFSDVSDVNNEGSLEKECIVLFTMGVNNEPLLCELTELFDFESHSSAESHLSFFLGSVMKRQGLHCLAKVMARIEKAPLDRTDGLVNQTEMSEKLFIHLVRVHLFLENNVNEIDDGMLDWPVKINRLIETSDLNELKSGIFEWRSSSYANLRQRLCEVCEGIEPEVVGEVVQNYLTFVADRKVQRLYVSWSQAFLESFPEPDSSLSMFTMHYDAGKEEEVEETKSCQPK